MNRSEVMSNERNAYLALLFDFAPLLVIAFTVFMLKGLKVVKSSYLGTSFMSRFVNVIITSAIGAILAVGCAALVPLVYPQANEASLFGIVVFLSVGGMRLMDTVLFKYLGIHLVDSTLEVSKSDSEWLTMSDEERDKCMKLWHERSKDNEQV